ncbi:hypothetical protein LCM08_00310 [Salipiger pacificus]|nr:hypothetical protein [Alloyangia pacifica]MCA0943348.1 hypothetical protein [Alloyangia pacifica]
MADESPMPSESVTLPPDLRALAQSGCGVAVASCGPGGTPLLGLGAGCRIGVGGRVRVLLPRAPNLALLTALEGGAAVAVTFTATRDHCSFQIKARRARLCPACSDDLPEIDRQMALFQDGLVEIGYSRLQATGYCAHQRADLMALELIPERVFTQTPGPGAGTELGA